MSNIKKRFPSVLIILSEVLICVFVIAAQDFQATIKVSSEGNVRVKGKLSNNQANQSYKNWSFTQSVVGAENLGSRISNFSLAGSKDQTIDVKQLIAGEYLANEQAVSFQYEIKVDALPNIKSKAHVSWIESENGIVMLDDLLPKFSNGKRTISATVEFELPFDWKVISSEKSLSNNVYFVKDYEKAIFALGKNWRQQENSNLSLSIIGDWQFSDLEALKMASEILNKYKKLYGEMPTEKVQIYVARFPKDTKFGRWEAETRGTNSTILSSDMPFKTQSLQRLHEQLRHELFHLWIPNNLALTGNYDWFYEGFTVYQALRTGIATNQIRFEDFLSTLAEAYNFDNFQTQKSSLIESSKNRWINANQQVYARGMIAAFLCDLALLNKSKNSRSINHVFQEIYRKHHMPNQFADGNKAILNVLKNYAELDSIVESYIKGTEKINWKTDLEHAGIAVNVENLSVKLIVSARLNRRQKDLLDELGYNNWRKSSEKSK